MSHANEAEVSPDRDHSGDRGEGPSAPELGGDADVDSHFQVAYQELLRVAHRHLAREQAGHTLNTTGLVHEAYFKLAGGGGGEWRDRGHFLAIASRAMRQILVDHARSRARQKRGGGVAPVTLRTDAGSGGEEAVDLLALDEALEQLASHDPRLVRLVECRFFGGLTAAETAEAMGVSLRTAERDWTRARAHLRVLLAG
jgi:RNA polymerase sigma factor (TIGR02999 family)